jgi:hypothetical protein
MYAVTNECGLLFSDCAPKALAITDAENFLWNLAI